MIKNYMCCGFAVVLSMKARCNPVVVLYYTVTSTVPRARGNVPNGAAACEPIEEHFESFCPVTVSTKWHQDSVIDDVPVE